MKNIFIFFLITISYAYAQKITLNTSAGLELINVKAEAIEHNGQQGIQVSRDKAGFEYETLVIIPGIEFENGTIEIELSGEPAPDADPNMRGFVGMAFRVNPENFSNYECFYLRPTNGRADNQLQRNHSTQYVSHPEYPWYKLRKENPGLYETYVDLEPGIWTKMKIEVDGNRAELYVHGAEQPTLIVNDLKKEPATGKIALWLHTTTLARYRNLIVSAK